MAQPNVAREPSMEEILASIRRIIESNEPGVGKATVPPLPPVYAVNDSETTAGIQLTVDDDYADVDFGDHTEVEEPRFVAANSPGVESRTVDSQPRTLSLADVAARVRAASERNAAQLREQNSVREVPTPIATRIMEDAFARSHPEPSYEAAAEPSAMISDTPVTHEQFYEAPAVPHIAEPVEAAPQMAEARTEPVDNMHSVAYATEEDMAEDQPALLSEAVGEQVARSFGELVAAVDGSQRRSMDEIAQDMLRPMLREWLDDNLPTLVERLVREEIERVARGPRR